VLAQRPAKVALEYCQAAVAAGCPAVRGW
jgi:hypothetical protein